MHFAWVCLPRNTYDVEIAEREDAILMIRRSCLMLACSLPFISEYGITQESLAKGVSGWQ
jgi:hypothetical protein